MSYNMGERWRLRDVNTGSMRTQGSGDGLKDLGGSV